MLTITIPSREEFDDETQTFVSDDEVDIDLEHSLASISKWESKFEKPFLGPEPKTTEETLNYIKCMCLTPKISPEVFSRLSNENFEAINAYISAKMTATWFNERKPGTGRKEIITAEIIYFWMIAFNIPMEWEHRHLNQLMTLIKVCDQKNNPGKQPKQSQRDAASERARMNAERKAKLQTQG